MLMTMDLGTAVTFGGMLIIMAVLSCGIFAVLSEETDDGFIKYLFALLSAVCGISIITIIVLLAIKVLS